MGLQDQIMKLELEDILKIPLKCVLDIVKELELSNDKYCVY